MRPPSRFVSLFVSFPKPLPSPLALKVFARSAEALATGPSLTATRIGTFFILLGHSASPRSFEVATSTSTTSGRDREEATAAPVSRSSPLLLPLLSVLSTRLRGASASDGGTKKDAIILAAGGASALAALLPASLVKEVEELLLLLSWRCDGHTLLKKEEALAAALCCSTRRLKRLSTTSLVVLMENLYWKADKSERTQGYGHEGKSDFKGGW